MSDKNEVTLESLVGVRMLDGVDFETIKGDKESYYEDSQAIRFRLDGVIYMAIENPDDGYRSSLGTLFISDTPMVNTFAPVRVTLRMKGSSDYQVDEILEGITESGETVLEVGTANTDDYYPYFVAYFNPKAITPEPSK